MDDENKELSAELKLKLLQVEQQAEKSDASRVKVLKSAITGAVAMAILPFFGIFRFPTWMIVTSSLLFGICGGILFGAAAVCRSNKK
ncbi:MAG: hypothetical protein IKC77_02225 [Lentisphaeria bacterium]|nr:hypothetical protein [Lentisphaeria bacterium]